MEADLKEARRRGTKLSSELGRLSQEAGRLQAQAEQAATRGRDLLAGAALEQVRGGEQAATQAATCLTSPLCPL